MTTFQCPACGEPISPGAEVCRNCAQPVCPDCGSAWPMNLTACPVCARPAALRTQPGAPQKAPPQAQKPVAQPPVQIAAPPVKPVHQPAYVPPAKSEAIVGDRLVGGLVVFAMLYSLSLSREVAGWVLGLIGIAIGGAVIAGSRVGFWMMTIVSGFFAAVAAMALSSNAGGLTQPILGGSVILLGYGIARIRGWTGQGSTQLTPRPSIAPPKVAAVPPPQEFVPPPGAIVVLLCPYCDQENEFSVAACVRCLKPI